VATPAATPTSFVDTGLTNGTTYLYRVTAVNAVGEGAYSNQASVTPQPPPSVPLGLTASPVDQAKGVTLSWAAPASPGGQVTGYKIYRSKTSGTEIFYLSVADVTTYKDTNVKRGTTYYYKVTAVSAGGESPLSNESFATAP